MDAAEQILSFKMHREPVVRKMIITLIPTLAVYDTQTSSSSKISNIMYDSADAGGFTLDIRIPFTALEEISKCSA